MKTIGPGVRELRLKDAQGIYRVIYLASVGHAIYVLHGFQKKTQRTSALDLDLAKARYRELMRKLK